jgi:hypothetical protein
MLDREIKTETGDCGPHRFNNYIWEGPGHRTEYAPLPIRNDTNTGWFDTRTVIPFRRVTSHRHPIESRRRSRLLARKYEEARVARSRRPRVIPNPFKVDADG